MAPNLDKPSRFDEWFQQMPMREDDIPRTSEEADCPCAATDTQELLKELSKNRGSHRLYQQLVRDCPLACASEMDVPVLKSSQIKQEFLLGRGSFCQVHRAHIADECIEFTSSCCLKSLRPNIDPSLRTEAQVDLWYEGYLLEKLPPHPNLIRLVGRSSSGGGLLLEEMKSGDLHRVLRGLGRQHKKSILSNLLQAPQVNRRLQEYALGIARGLAHLHSNDIVLRDLKPSNIGLQRHPCGLITPKLLDLGLARHVDRIPPTDHGGSLRYMAPELFGGAQSATLDSDVYSFAIVLWEICTLQQAYHAMIHALSDFQASVQKGRRPHLSNIASPKLRKLLSKCWRVDPSKRPKMSEVVQELESLIAYQLNHNSKGKSNTEIKKTKPAWKYLVGCWCPSVNFNVKANNSNTKNNSKNSTVNKYMTRQLSTTSVSESTWL